MSDVWRASSKCSARPLPDVRLVGSVFDVDLGLFSMLPNLVVILPLGRLLRRRIGFTLFQPM